MYYKISLHCILINLKDEPQKNIIFYNTLGGLLEILRKGSFLSSRRCLEGRN